MQMQNSVHNILIYVRIETHLKIFSTTYQNDIQIQAFFCYTGQLN